MALVPHTHVLAGIAGGLEDHLECARRYGLGVEIQYLTMPPWLSKDCRAEAERVRGLIDGIDGPIGFHGHFMDTCHVSPDPLVCDLSRDRYNESLDLAEILGASFVVFHTQYNTALRLPDYADTFHEASLRFWPDVADEAKRRGIKLMIENMFDVDPEPIARMAREIDHPAFRLCFDVAHAEIHSDIPTEKWIEAFGDYLDHVHINDCDGENDLHQELGEGSLDLIPAIEQLVSLDRPLTYTLETRTSGDVSAQFLGLEPRA